MAGAGRGGGQPPRRNNVWTPPPLLSAPATSSSSSSTSNATGMAAGEATTARAQSLHRSVHRKLVLHTRADGSGSSSARTSPAPASATASSGAAATAIQEDGVQAKTSTSKGAGVRSVEEKPSTRQDNSKAKASTDDDRIAPTAGDEQEEGEIEQTLEERKNAKIHPGREIVINGVTFIADAKGKKLVRKDCALPASYERKRPGLRSDCFTHCIAPRRARAYLCTRLSRLPGFIHPSEGIWHMRSSTPCLSHRTCAAQYAWPLAVQAHKDGLQHIRPLPSSPPPIPASVRSASSHLVPSPAAIAWSHFR